MSDSSASPGDGPLPAPAAIALATSPEPLAAAGLRVPRPIAPANRTLHWVLWSVLILVIGALTANFVRQSWKGMERRDITPLEHFNTVPAFMLTDQNDQPFGTTQVAGKIWLANFFFTTCPGPCLRMNAKMMEIQQALSSDHSDVRLVSFSINPEQDTPAVLRHYAERFKAPSDRWAFLTGERARIYDVAKRGFMLIAMEAPADGKNATDPDAAAPPPSPAVASAVAVPPSSLPVPVSAAATAPTATATAPPSTEPQFIHSTKIALVDRNGVVRRYYDSENAEVIQHVLSDVGSLLREQPAVGGNGVKGVQARPGT